MLHGDERFPEAADFKGLVKSRVVCHAGMLLGGGMRMGGMEGCQEAKEKRVAGKVGR